LLPERRFHVKRTLQVLLLVAVAGATSGCGTLSNMWRATARTGAVAFTGAQADEMPLYAMKLSGCEEIPVPEGFPLKSLGCLMPIRVLSAGEQPTNAEVAALAAVPITEDSDWIFCPPASLTDRGTSGVTSEQCRAVPNFAVMTASVRPASSGGAWVPSRLTYEEK
jgi:hypothetical protein